MGVTGVHARGVPTGVRARRVCVGDECARDGGSDGLACVRQVGVQRRGCARRCARGVCVRDGLLCVTSVHATCAGAQRACDGPRECDGRGCMKVFELAGRESGGRRA